MKQKNFYAKFTLIISMLVVTLTLFCFDIKNVKADNLTSLDAIKYPNSLTPSFNPNTYDYTISIPKTEIDLLFNYTKENLDDEVNITNNKYLKNDTGLITIVVSGTKYKITYNKVDASSFVNNYSFTNGVQIFTSKLSGRSHLELWGASDSTNTSLAGYGAYTSGYLDLKCEDTQNIKGIS